MVVFLEINNSTDSIILLLNSTFFQKPTLFTIDSNLILVDSVQSATDSTADYWPYLAVGAGVVLAGTAIYVLASTLLFEPSITTTSNPAKFLAKADEHVCNMARKAAESGAPIKTMENIDQNILALRDNFQRYGERIIYDTYPSYNPEIFGYSNEYIIYRELFRGVHNDIFNMCHLYGASTMDYCTLMNNTLIFMYDASGTFILPFLFQGAEELISTAATMNELKVFTEHTTEELKTLFGQIYTYDEIVEKKRMFEELRLRERFDHTLFLREVSLYRPKVRGIGWFESEVATRLAQSGFLDSIYAKSLPELEKIIAQLSGQEYYYTGCKLPSTNSTSSGFSESIAYAEKLMYAFSVDANKPSQFDF